MKITTNLIIPVCLTFMILIFGLNGINAEQWQEKGPEESKTGVFIPDHEFIGYYDSNDIYTVVGAIKNQEEFAVIPNIVIIIEDDKEIISRTLEFVPISPSKELPFVVKFPDVTSPTPILMEPEISFVPTKDNPINVEVIYDETLVQHEDGHLTGRIINNGTEPVFNVKVFAVIHGMQHETLDIGQNLEFIDSIDPGEVREFSMYPDPSVTAEVFYYSCFAVTDSFVRPVYSERNGEKFYFRYDSGSWYTAPQFNEIGTELSMRTLNSFPLETYANFEFPKVSDDEKFDVFVNGERKKSIQSIDEDGNWHVAFNVNARERGEVIITGFEEGYDPGDKILIPDWVKRNAFWWSGGEIPDDTFIKGIEFLIKENIIKVTEEKTIQEKEKLIPEWFKVNAGWWSEGKVPDETFVIGLEYLIERGIIGI